MTTSLERVQDESGPSGRAESERFDELQPIERLSLVTLLQGLLDRTTCIEAKLTEPTPSRQPILDFMKIALGGWPAFGFLFLILFYAPLRDALSSIPPKIRSASEIGLAGVTLRSTITEVAALQGVERIGKTIPQLSSTALQLLLRAPAEADQLISFGLRPNPSRITDFSFPTPDARAGLIELSDKGFIHLVGSIEGPREPLDGPGMEKLLQSIPTRFPGRPGITSQWETEWELDDTLDSQAEIPGLTWQLTDTGKAAVRVVLSAVVAELSRTQVVP